MAEVNGKIIWNHMQAGEYKEARNALTQQLSQEGLTPKQKRFLLDIGSTLKRVEATGS